jgi:hypothetical protein
MGWWNAGTDGSSLHMEQTGLTWGDSVADIMDEAISQIVKEFQDAWKRTPTREELEAGLKFALSTYEGSHE